MNSFRDCIKVLCPGLHRLWRRYCAWQKRMETRELYLYDYVAMLKYSSAFLSNNQEADLSRIIMSYHVLEKGLTMPNRHLAFGKTTVLELIDSLEGFEKRYGCGDVEFVHAVGVIRAYYDLHVASVFDFTTAPAYWDRVRGFCERHAAFESRPQWHFTKGEFYSKRNAAFAEFARSRHTCRHYVEGAVIPDEMIAKVVELAQTAPSACNRQHVRVHCVVDKKLKEHVRNLQGGNRGFGQNADKFLVVTSDICDLRWPAERYDLYTNAGIFVMNLCYALHYYEIAHCVLHWSMDKVHDHDLRKLLSLPENERIVCMLACGVAPDEFEIATSCRKSVDSILSYH